MLSAEDQAECMTHLPSFDVIREDTNGEGGSNGEAPAGLRLVKGFFERNSALNADVQNFQVPYSHPNLIRERSCRWKI